MNMMKLCLFFGRKIMNTDGEIFRDRQEEFHEKIVIIFSFEVYNMPTTSIKYENVFPENIYHCPCLKNTIEEIFKAEIWCYSEIILAVSECCQCDSNVYCLRVQEKLSCLFLCQAQKIITLLLEAKFDCTSMDEKDLLFNAF